MTHMRIPSSKPWLEWLSRNNAQVTLMILFLGGALALPNFLTEINLAAILFQYSIIGLLALGQLLVILSGGIDLSQGAQIALTSIVTAVLMTSHGVWTAVLGGVLVTTASGLASGILVSRTRMPPFVVTLGMLGVVRGLALLIANARPVPINVAPFVAFGAASVIGVPVSTFVWAGASLAMHWLLTKRPLGRHVYAVGSSEESARLSGIDVRVVKLSTYAISAVLAAVAGIIWTARLSSGSPIGGSNYEMESIAAVVVGGGSLSGGQGTVSGTVAGVLIFGVINSILNLAGISPYWQGTLKGIILLLAVAMSQVRRSRWASR